MTRGDPGAWTTEEAAVLRTAPAAVAAQLAVLGSDLPGFDNGDRAHLRRVAHALGGMQRNRDEALRLAREAMAARASIAAQCSRPEAVLLQAVLYLLAHDERLRQAAEEQAGSQAA